MKHLAKHDRPREKLQRLGVAALGDNELVAIVLASGSRDCGALELANRLLERAGGLYGLTRTAPEAISERASCRFGKAAAQPCPTRSKACTSARRPRPS